MENITIGQIFNFIITFSAVLSAGGVICKMAFKSGKLVLNNSLEPFNKKIDEVVALNNKRFTELQLQTDKNYLVNFLSRIENNQKIDETELEHFYFTYDDYHKNNGNSYIDHKVEKLKKEGKL